MRIIFWAAPGAVTINKHGEPLPSTLQPGVAECWDVRTDLGVSARLGPETVADYVDEVRKRFAEMNDLRARDVLYLIVDRYEGFQLPADVAARMVEIGRAHEERRRRLVEGGDSDS